MSGQDDHDPFVPRAALLPDGYSFGDGTATIDWVQLSELYRIAALEHNRPGWLEMVFGNSMFRSLVYADGRIVGAGRGLADGLDAAYLADIAVRPDHQRRGVGLALVHDLVRQCTGHRKIVLYATGATQSFFRRAGFVPMETAMAIWRDPAAGIAAGFLREDD
jgi:ribosomal protein S18 acetylase RimI-like enzyme